MRWSLKGYTLIELMIVLAIIIALIAIAIPSYLSIRTTAKKNVCIANLKQIDTAIDQWSFINDVNEGIELTPCADEIYSFLLGERPTCPSGGIYILTSLGNNPQVRCTIEGHQLP